jgi:hypothetical protein
MTFAALFLNFNGELVRVMTFKTLIGTGNVFEVASIFFVRIFVSALNFSSIAGRAGCKVVDVQEANTVINRIQFVTTQPALKILQRIEK